MKKFLKYTFRTILVIVLILFLLFFSTFYLIQQPKVQTYLVHKVSEYLSKELGSTVKVDSVSISFIRTLDIYGVYLSSQKNKSDTILYVNKLGADLMLGKNLVEQITHLRDKRIYVDNISMDGLRLYGYRGIDDSLYNYQFILSKFASKNKKAADTTINSSPLELKLNKLNLTNGKIILDDHFKDKRFDIQFTKVFIDLKELNVNHLKIDAKQIELVDPFFKLTQYNEKEKKPSGKPSKGFDVQGLGKKLNITIDKLTIANGIHSMDFHHKDQKAGTFLISRMNIHEIQLDFRNYRWDSTGMHVDMKKLQAQADSNAHVKKLEGIALLDNGGIYLDNADIAFNDSRIRGNLSIQFLDEWRSFRDFQNKVILKADLKEVLAKSKDVGVFAPKLLKYLPANVAMHGSIKGKLANLRIDELDLKTGKNTVINITGNIKGLPKINQTLFDIKANTITTSTNDLKTLLPFFKMPEQLKNAGTIHFKGSYFGFINDFVARGNLTTSNLGSITTDVRMSFPKGKAPNYSGNIIATKINIAELTGNHKLFGTADVDLNANGNGFNAKDLNTRLTGTIRNFYFNGFVFDKIKVDGLLDKKKFKGKAFYDDNCLLIDFNGTADFNEKLPKFDFVTSIKNADLKKLNFTKDTLMISLNGEVHAIGNNIENLKGTGKFSNLILQNAKDILVLSDVDIDLQNDGSTKNYTITSDQFNANFVGEFDPVTLVPSMKVFLSNYSKLIKPKEKDYKLSRPQQLEASLKLKSDFGLFKVFVPDLKYISELDLNASINTEENLFEINAKMDSANYKNIAFNNIGLTGDIQDRDLLLNSEIKKIQSGKTAIEDIHLGINSSLEQLLTHLNISNDTSDNAVRLLSTLDFNKDTITAKILNSKLMLNKKVWTVQKENELVIIDSIFIAKNFSLIQDKQKINIQNGRNTLSDAKINIENLDLIDIGQLIDSTGAIKNGKLSGTVNLKNILTKLQANADITINDLQVLDYKVKYIGLDGVYGRNGKKIIEAGGTIEDDNYQLSFDGTYDMQVPGKENLDVDADIEKVNLNFLEALLKKELLVPRAFVKGNVKVTGNIKKPVLLGEAQIIDTAELKMRYLGTTFKLVNEEVKLTQKGFDFGEMTVYDNYGNTALVSGKLQHSGFKNFKAENVSFSAPSGFNFMNITYDDNQDFYGKVFAKGEVSISGFFNDLFIDVTRMETMKNTEFNLPVSDKAADKGYSFVKFVDPRDTIKKIDYKSKISGLNLNMNITATPDAVANIILDPSSNDKIIGRGEGNLNLTMNKKGELNIEGTYNLTEGKYDFNFQGILNKTFNVRKGSTINFNGDPLKAELNIVGLYNVKAASVRNIVDSNSTIKNRTFPIDLNLLITGTLEKTKIGFRIAPTEGSASAQSDELMRVLDEISKNDAEVDKQAGTLLLFSSFWPLGTASDQKFQAYSNTVTQLLTSQISKLLSQGLSQVIKGASIDLLLSDLESKESRNFGFSYKQELLGSRLILTIGGNVNFGNANNTVANTTTGQTTNNTGIAGDFLLEYLVTPDGRIRLKTYARTTNYTTDIINQDRVRTGGAISFQKDFDSLKELFRPKNKKDKKPKETPADTSSLKPINQIEDKLKSKKMFDELFDKNVSFTSNGR